MLCKVNKHAHDNSEIRPWSVRSGDRIPAMTGLELNGEVLGPLGQFELVKRFASPFDDQIAEVSYKFPLPGDAAITSAVIEFGDVVITAELKAHGEAVREYTEARSEGRQAAIVERVEEDTFSLHACGLLPGQPFVIRIKFFAISRPHVGAYRAIMPTIDYMLRFHHGTGLALPAGPEVPALAPSATTASGGLSGSIRIRYCGSASCNLPHLASRDGDDVVMSLDGSIPDRHLALDYAPPRAERTKMTMFVHDDGAKKYFLGMVVAGSAAKIVSQDVALAVDSSGSMCGPKSLAAQEAAGRWLEHFRGTDDRVCPMVFESASYAFSSRPTRVAEMNGASLALFRACIGARGGTNMNAALSQMGMVLGPGEPGRPRAAILVTDMQVDSSVLDQAKALGAPVHVIMVGAAPNDYLAHRMAAMTGGSAKYLAEIPGLEDDLSGCLDQVANPVATGVKVILGGADKAEFDVGSLYRDYPAMFVGCCPSSDEPSLELLTNEGIDFQTLCVEGSFPAIRGLYGSNIVYGLERELIEASAGPSNAAACGKLVAASLEFGVICSQTAFVAVGRKVGPTMASWREEGFPGGQDATLARIPWHAVSGCSGSGGSSGASGFGGFHAASGFSGMSGPVSPRKFSGFSGQSGHSGKSGSSGFSAGLAGESANATSSYSSAWRDMSRRALLNAEVQRLAAGLRYNMLVAVPDYALTKLALRCLRRLGARVRVLFLDEGSMAGDMVFLGDYWAFMCDEDDGVVEVRAPVGSVSILADIEVNAELLSGEALALAIDAVMGSKE